MFDTDTASNGVKFALLEGQLLSRAIDRAAFVDRAAMGRCRCTIPPAQQRWDRTISRSWMRSCGFMA
jgi:hypothetical protein